MFSWLNTMLTFIVHSLLKHLRFALDPKGKPIGVCINNACYESEMEDTTDKVQPKDSKNVILILPLKILSDVSDPQYKPLAAIHHELRLKNRHIYQEIDTDKFFSIRMVGVENSQRGMGVATELIRR